MILFPFREVLRIESGKDGQMDLLHILPAVSTVFIVISAILVAIGWYLIIKRRVNAHRKVMFWAGVTALIFFIIYLSKTVFVGNTQFGGPHTIKMYYTAFLIFHITLATIGGAFGLITLWTGYKSSMRNHRRLGPLTSIVWFFSAITGVAVYTLLYLLYPGGETTSLVKAVLGF